MFFYKQNFITFDSLLFENQGNYMLNKFTFILFIIWISIFGNLNSLIALSNDFMVVSAISFISTSQFNTSRKTNLDNIQYYNINQKLLVENLNSSKNIFLEDFPVSLNENLTIELIRTRSVIDANTKFITHTASGEKELPMPVLLSFKGKIKNEPNSSVYLVFSGNNLFSKITRQDGKSYIFGPSNNNTELNNEHVIISEKNFYRGQKLNFQCDMSKMEDKIFKENKIFEPKALSNNLLETELALETDTEFFKAAGGTLAKSQAYALSLISLVSMVYEDEVNICFYLTWLKTWTDNPTDPYHCGGDPFVLRDSVLNYWKTNYKDVKRDVAHIVTSIGYGGGGYGYLGALCGGAGDYSYSTSSVQGGHSYPTFAFTYDIYIIAHEIGHNFNGQHTHSCFFKPPIDTCVVTDGIAGGCLDSNQQPLPNPGSIMSYCGGINNQVGLGWQVRMTFLTQNQNIIRSAAEAASCITEPVNPKVSLLNPHGQEIYKPGDSILIKWVSSRVSNVNIEYSTDKGISWLNIATNLISSPNSYQWKAPDICSKAILVRIYDNLNHSTGDTTKLTFSVIKDDPNGLVAYYPFNGNSNDEQMCHFYYAQGINNPVLFDDRFGNKNGAYEFNGSNYFYTPDFKFDFDEMTASFWFNLNNLDNKKFILGTNWQKGWVFELYFWGQYGVSYYTDGSGSPTQIWGGGININTWYHGAFTLGNQTAKLYLNGIKVAELTAGKALNKFTTPFFIGARDSSEFFSGKIDDIRIYKRALSREEITALYNEPPTDVIDNNQNSFNQEIEIFPNPVNESATVKFINNVNLPVSLKVLNTLGEVVCSMDNYQFHGNQIIINTESFPPGIYFCRFLTENQLINKKMIIVR